MDFVIAHASWQSAMEDQYGFESLDSCIGFVWCYSNFTEPHLLYLGITLISSHPAYHKEATNKRLRRDLLCAHELVTRLHARALNYMSGAASHEQEIITKIVEISHIMYEISDIRHRCQNISQVKFSGSANPDHAC